jgi:2-polyprenyl-6-methoxyphenol hydroxylase-like FAD-dependent oxidoreductase
MKKKILISGASFAGLTTAWWMNKLGYQVTVVEISEHLKKGGSPVNIKDATIDIVKQMGLFEQIKANRICMELNEFKNADDVTVSAGVMTPADDEFEIERDVLLQLLFDAVKQDITFIFSNSITALCETASNMEVTFKDGSQDTFELVLGCDGVHSVVRKLWFGSEATYAHFLQKYFYITIVNKLLIRENTFQMYGEPDKAVMLNAYNQKTDIVFSFHADEEIPYDHRDKEAQKQLIQSQFAGLGWRIPAFLEEVQQAGTFYFDKFCQIRMPNWSRGRVALVGDAGYCASPAAGMGGSLAIIGAGALADALGKYDYPVAFDAYEKGLRPFIDEVQAGAVQMLAHLIPRTAEEIHQRNIVGFNF